MRTRLFREFIAVIFAALSFAFSIHAQETKTLSEEQRIEIALEAVSRIQSDIRTNAELKRAVYKLLEKTRSKSAFVEVVKKFNLRDHDDGLLEIAIANPSSDFGVEAMRLVLSGGTADLLEKKIADSDAQTLSKIAEALGNTREKKSVPFLKSIATNSRNDVAMQKIAIKSLAQTEEGASALLILAKDETFPSDLKSAAAAELNGARWPKIKAEAAELLPTLRGENSKVLLPIPELVKIKGNAANGQNVFFSEIAACASCHKINGRGAEIGPNLTEIGNKLGKDALFEAILEPSAGISFGYEAFSLELKSGDEAYGLLASETEDEIAIKDLKGIVTRFKKAEIAQKSQLTTSLMPTGLAQNLSLEQLADLVEFLSTLKKAN